MHVHPSATRRRCSFRSATILNGNDKAWVGRWYYIFVTDIDFAHMLERIHLQEVAGGKSQILGFVNILFTRWLRWIMMEKKRIRIDIHPPWRVFCLKKSFALSSSSPYPPSVPFFTASFISNIILFLSMPPPCPIENVSVWLDFTRDLWEWRGWCYAIIIPSSTYANLCVYLSKDCWAVIQTYFRGELPVRGILGAGWLVPCNYIKCTNSNWCCITGTEVATLIEILLWIKWTNGQGDKNCYRSAQVVIYKEYTHYKQVLIKFRSFALSVRTDLSEDKVKDQIIIHSSHDTTIRIWSRQVNPSNWEIIEGIFVFWEFYNLIKCTGAFLLLSCGRVLPASWTPAKWIIEIKRPFHLPKVHRRQSVNCQVGRSVVRSEYVKQKRRGRWAVGHHRHR